MVLITDELLPGKQFDAGDPAAKLYVAFWITSWLEMAIEICWVCEMGEMRTLFVNEYCLSLHSLHLDG